MLLKDLTDKQLIASTNRALHVSREAEVSVLHHFHEIEERKLWTGAGSLYKYIVRTFGLTADQIYPRLQAMRLMRSLPEIEKKLASGALSVTNAMKAQQVFASESKRRLVSHVEKKQMLEKLEHTSTREADRLLAEKYPTSKPPPERVKPVAKNKNLIQFYVDDETLNQIEELKARFAHQMPSGKMEDLLKILIRKAQPEPQPRKRVTIKKRSRHIPTEVKRRLEKTCHLGCAHVDDETGARGASKHFLQMDHILEYCRGSPNEVSNLRWLCGFHNRSRFETSADSSTRRKTRQTSSRETG